MALYKNTNTTSALTAVEFSPVSNGNFSFFYVDKPESTEGVKQWLTSAGVGQEIVAETMVNGKPMLVTQGDKSKDDMLKAVEAQGDKLQLTHRDRKVSNWVWRGALSMTGQPMQLASAAMSTKGLDPGTAGFAILNLTANFVNMIFGAQKSDDIHRLRHTKKLVSDGLDEFMVPGDAAPAIDDVRAPLRHGPPEPKSLGERFHGFMQRNSVMLGEIGLRYIGGISLVMPIVKKNAAGKYSLAHWSEGVGKLFKGEVTEAFHTVKNPDKFTRIAGSFWLAGKTIGFLSKAPDPFNPAPRSWFENFRQKYVFRISTITETLGASTMAFDRLDSKRDDKWKVIKDGQGKAVPRRTITFPDKKFIPAALRGKTQRDYLGGVGAMLFMTAFAMRFFAPFGVKELNMEEVYAHAADTLALTPPEKLPQLIAETAATLKEHLKDKHIEYGEIYTKMMTDLYRYHHIALQMVPPLSVAGAIALGNDKNADEPVSQKKFTDANPSRSLQERALTPAASHTDAAAQKSQFGPAL